VGSHIGESGSLQQDAHVQQDGGVVVNDSDVGHGLLPETSDGAQTRPTVRHRSSPGKNRRACSIRLRDEVYETNLNQWK
jgi:hypothetical protein